VHSRNVVNAAMTEGSACSDSFAFRDKVSYYFHEVCGSTAVFLSQILCKEKQTAYYHISLIYMPLFTNIL
jgi:hypothetical protein